MEKEGGLTKEEVKKKAEELNYSRDIYARRAGRYPQVKDGLDFFYKEISAEYNVKRYAKKYRDHIRIFILDLLVADVVNPEMYLTYSKNGNDYSPKGRYGKIHLSYDVTLNVVRYLEKYGYIEHHPGKKNIRLPRIRATKKLIDRLIKDFKIEVGMYIWDWDEANNPTVILRKKKIKKDDPYEEIDYKETEDTLGMKKNLRLINRNNEKHAIFPYIPDDSYKKLFIRMGKKGSSKGVADLTRKWNRRVFNNGTFADGGRFYSGFWQSLPKEYRQYIRLNGKDVVECDYSGQHIHLLYALEEKKAPEGDVYHLPGYSNDKTFRDFVKRLQLVLLNSKSRDEARRAIYSAVRMAKTLELPKEVPSTRAEDLYPLMDAFEKKHHQIKQYFFTGIGIKLQNIDSQMAEQVLVHFSNMGYPILPVHDSFIIHHGLEQELKDTMNKAFKEILEVNIDIEIELKYNSIEVRQKQEKTDDPDYLPGPCNLSLPELLEIESEDGEYGIYHKLFNQFMKYKQR